MKVCVSADMEGVTGLTDPEEMRAGGRGHERGCDPITADAAAAIGGRVARAGGVYG